MLEKADHRLDGFGKTLRAYLAAILHADIVLEPWQGGGELPLYLTRRYRFYSTQIATRRCLFAAAEALDATPAAIARNIDQIKGAFDGIVAFATDHMSSTFRARLVAQGIPFAVPGNQLYIPQLATDLREHFRAPDKARGDRLSPAAQVVLFDHILRRRHEFTTPSLRAADLRYSPMTIGRAFDELAQRNLATIEWRGRSKMLHFKADGRTLFESCRTLLRSPVRGVHAVVFEGATPPMQLAGESALSALTHLSPPLKPTYAIDASKWVDFFARHKIRDLHYEYEGEAIIETWRYDPGTLSGDDTVDPLSLHAQFWDNPDERVAQAALDVLERVQW